MEASKKRGAIHSDIVPEVMFGNFHLPTDQLQTAVALLVAILGPTEDLKWHGQDNGIPDTPAAREAYAAAALEIEAPKILMDRDKGPSSEIMEFCRSTGVSLDFIFCGDVKGMLRRAYRQEKGEVTP